MQIMAPEKPFRPWPVKLMNNAGDLLARLGVQPIKLDRDDIVVRAAKQAGVRVENIKTLGDMAFLEGLGRVIDSLESEASLNVLGRMMARGTLVDNLANRFRLLQWRCEHPELAGQEIRKPLFILGLPRTGTTILHALLDVDPANRSPLFWEVAYPVPPATPETWRGDPRIAKDQKLLDGLYKLCPGFEAVHPMGATMPQECVAIFAMEMLAESFHATFNVPSYIEWLDEQPLTRAYDFHKQFLQHLQSGGVMGERWLLKSPCHLHLIPQLLTTYPDAHIIHTHRNPVDVCVSISSLMAMLRGIGSDAICLDEIGRQQIAWWSRLLQRAVDQRKQLESTHGEQFFDLRMNELVADPIGSVERLYDHFGYDMPARVKRNMEQYMKDNARDRHGSHTYHAEDFAIDRDKDRSHFADYCAYFDV